jgi:hypothetical protein
MIIRIGYCPPSPGPKADTGCKWFNTYESAIKYCEERSQYSKCFLYIKRGNDIYRKISYIELLELYERDGVSQRQVEESRFD